MEQTFTTPYNRKRLLDFEDDQEFVDLFKTCKICAEQSEFIIFITHGCNGHYCIDCYEQWISTKVKDGTTNIKCPTKDCGRNLHSDLEVLAYISGVLLEKYQHLQTLDALRAMPGFCQCPGINCANGFIVPESYSYATCNVCNIDVCTKCKEIYHKGMSCEEYKISRAESDPTYKESLKWKEENTKSCPSCKAPTLKSSGCDHIKCTVCGTEFCFQCGSKYTDGHIREKHYKPNPAPYNTQLITQMAMAQKSKMKRIKS